MQDASPQVAGVAGRPAPIGDAVSEESRPVDLDKAGAPSKPETPKPETPKPETPVAEARPGDTPDDASPPNPADRQASGWRPVMMVGAVAVVLAVIAVIAAFRPGAEVSNQAWVDTTATREVTEAATRAIETMHGYNYETIDEDFAEIRGLLSAERLEEFDATADVTKQAAIQTRTVTEVDTLHVGTSMLDDSHAEVAAFINVSATGDGIAQGSAQAPVLVRMEKSDGRWLVSEIRDR